MQAKSCLLFAGYCFENFPLAAGESKKEAVQKLTKSMTDKCTSLAKARELTN
jgi:hypothetical protein